MVGDEILLQVFIALWIEGFRQRLGWPVAGHEQLPNRFTAWFAQGRRAEKRSAFRRMRKANLKHIT